MSTDTGQGVNDLDGLSSILAKMCEAQVTLTHSVNELVIAQKTTNELIGTLIKDRTAGCGKGITAATRIEDTTNENEKEQDTNDLRHITPDVVLNPVAQVIGTFELLEQILLDDGISMQTVLLAQRVNTTFLAIITKSMPLQRKLFLAPQPNMGFSGVPSLNPLLENVLGNLPLWLNPETKAITRMAHQATAHHISLEKMETRNLGQAQDGDSSRTGAQLHYVQGTMSSRDNSVGILGHGSWERMLLSQPPCACLFMSDRFSSRRSRDNSVGKSSIRDFRARDRSGGWDIQPHRFRRHRTFDEFLLHFSIAKDIGTVGGLLRVFAAADATHSTSSQHAELSIGQAMVDGETLRCDAFGRR
ncbi:hypothetical protein LTR17_001307 [Elasticomyces elasticus]|nr:hypothetical protein LTR17_001307 [Elasticomyces elasticus]